MKLKCFLLFLALTASAFGQMTAPVPPTCAAPPSPTVPTGLDAAVCSMEWAKYANLKFLYDNEQKQNTAMAELHAQMDGLQSNVLKQIKDMAFVVTAQQGQIDSNVRVDVDMQSKVDGLTTQVDTLKTQLAPLVGLTKGPVISMPTVATSTGMATITWTAYVTGQAVIVWGIAPGGYNSAGYPTGSGPSYTFAVTKPSGTTLYYRIKHNFDGYQLISPEYTVKIL